MVVSIYKIETFCHFVVFFYFHSGHLTSHLFHYAVTIRYQLISMLKVAENTKKYLDNKQLLFENLK